MSPSSTRAPFEFPILYKGWGRSRICVQSGLHPDCWLTKPGRTGQMSKSGVHPCSPQRHGPHYRVGRLRVAPTWFSSSRVTTAGRRVSCFTPDRACAVLPHPFPPLLLLYSLINPLVDASCDSISPSPSSSGRIVFDNCLPSSTPHWSKELIRQMIPCTKILCS
jgi:hypothetical protein